jgi:hypothetical protein
LLTHLHIFFCFGIPGYLISTPILFNECTEKKIYSSVRLEVDIITSLKLSEA